jgi:hypothetical protein
MTPGDSCMTNPDMPRPVGGRCPSAVCGKRLVVDACRFSRRQSAHEDRTEVDVPEIPSNGATVVVV